MINKILITNNTTGNHSPDTWAMAAAEALADVSGLTGAKAIEAQRLQLKFADVLVKHFNASQAMEQERLANDPKHVLTDLGHHVVADLMMVAQELEVAASGSFWEDHFRLPEVQKAVMAELRILFKSSMHVDRLVHCDKNPNCEHAAAYKAAHHGGKI